jgi:hypothetical protein
MTEKAVAAARLGVGEAPVDGPEMARTEASPSSGESREAWLERKLERAATERAHNERKLRRQRLALHETNEALRARAVQVRRLVEVLDSLTRQYVSSEQKR